MKGLVVTVLAGAVCVLGPVASAQAQSAEGPLVTRRCMPERTNPRLARMVLDAFKKKLGSEKIEASVKVKLVEIENKEIAQQASPKLVLPMTFQNAIGEAPVSELKLVARPGELASPEHTPCRVNVFYKAIIKFHGQTTPLPIQPRISEVGVSISVPGAWKSKR